ncbi:cell wall-binding repeat-containing protein [Metabacillus indicus]|uniref:cell wall-binding repeat-containing protein n=1 Tax=Metabacillus indicus TaxID=246786 RepID=UPI00049322F0|nr:cell wall-binding repeat-containing protein [Metabacillus indicus]KEZ48779.1 hypothetical protein AZ46_0217980 [Metabacillus indicus LMG 22858]
MKKRVSWAAGVLFAVLLFFAPASGFAEKVLVIDPGHGGKFSGTCGLTGNQTGFCEKSANLIVSQKVRDLLKASDINVYLTRDTDKAFASFLSGEGGDFENRMKIANGFAKGNNDNSVFISIHHNAHPTNTYVKGYETYFYNGVDHAKPEYPHDPMQIKYLQDNRRLAAEVHPTVLSKLGSVDRGIADTQSFYVIRNAQMPALLVEMGFMTNREEEARIKTSDFQNKAAQGIVQAVTNYFKVYEVYDAKNNKLLTEKSKEKALDFAYKQSSYVRVFDKNAQKDIYAKNAEYTVYDKNGAIGEFYSQTDAQAFAGKKSGTRVVSQKTGYTVWSNYLPAKYNLYVSGVKKGSYYDFEYARSEAQKYSPNAKVVNNKSGEIVHSNISGEKVTRSLDLQKMVGATRYETAINVSKKMYPQGFSNSKAEKTVIIATGSQYADALSAGPLSRIYDKAPMILVKGNALDASVKNEIIRLKASKAVIVGGEAAVSRGIETELKSMKIATDRISGEDRYHTNRLILNRLGNVTGYFVASGRNYPDALGAAPLAASGSWAIMLSDTNSIYYDARVKLKDKHAIILGGNAVLTSNIDYQVKNIGPKSMIRLGGSDRYETLAKVLWHFDPYLNSDSIMLSTGKNFPDALAAAPLATITKAPLILTGEEMNRSIEGFIMSYGGKHHIDEITQIGGAVSSEIAGETANRVR